MARIILEHRGQVIKDFPLHRGNLTIGRRGDNTIVLSDPQVSSYHARIDKRGADFILTDLQSTNGTLVNSRRVFSHRLSHGDRIAIGKHALLFIGTEKARIDAELEKVPLDQTVIIGGTPRTKAPSTLQAGMPEPPSQQPQSSGLLRRLVFLFLVVGVIVGIGLWSFRDKAPFIRGLLWKDAAEVGRESRTPLGTEQVPIQDEPISPVAQEPIEASKADSGFAIEAIVWSSDGTNSFALINGVKVMAGDAIQGMTVQDIGRDYVVLRSEDGRSTLRLTLTLK
jgi:hypothetical protein